MGDMIEFTSNGIDAQGYLAVPESGSGPGVIVVVADAVTGPAIVTEAETTIIIPAGYAATGRADGCIDVEKLS